MFCHKCGAQMVEGAVFCHKCGTKAVYEEDGAFWALKKDGEDTPASADQTPIQDGDAFSLVYTVA